MSDLSRKARVTAVKFTDVRKGDLSSYSPRRFDYILAGAGHLLILSIGLIAFSSSAEAPSGGDEAIMVKMVTVASVSEISPAEVTDPSEIQEEPTQISVSAEEPVEEEIIENPNVEEHPENPIEENPEEILLENPPEEISADRDDFASLSGEGLAGAAAPGPGTFESRVFNAVRRVYRTSVEPERSYRIILTVNPDGTTSIEVIRRSGTSAFDRAVENALTTAQIPPMPPGRRSPAVINIEFFGPEQ
ncbi:MAG: TonB C-terminal domain-containing protein [Candidatus Aegiribacteria sp.]|nr:TonB C-terminal domain-containing protein [Candidatus Aegiribacteria sp.]